LTVDTQYSGGSGIVSENFFRRVLWAFRNRKKHL